jgi:hypothetical protein
LEGVASLSTSDLTNPLFMWKVRSTHAGDLFHHILGTSTSIQWYSLQPHHPTQYAAGLRYSYICDSLPWSTYGWPTTQAARILATASCFASCRRAPICRRLLVPRYLLLRCSHLHWLV